MWKKCLYKNVCIQKLTGTEIAKGKYGRIEEWPRLEIVICEKLFSTIVYMPGCMKNH